MVILVVLSTLSAVPSKSFTVRVGNRDARAWRFDCYGSDVYDDKGNKNGDWESSRLGHDDRCDYDDDDDDDAMW